MTPVVRLGVALLLLPLSCRPQTAPTYSLAPAERVPSGNTAPLRDWEDCERLQGERITVQGIFDHVQGTHGTVRLDSGLVLRLPNIDLFLRNRPWFDYVDQRVLVSGTLHAYRRELPGFEGPCLLVDSFQVLQQ